MGWSSLSNRKLENFSKALKNLEDSTSYQPPFDVVTEAGLVSLFQICMEQSWKAMKYTLDQHGFSEAQTGSPRKVVKCAYSAGMIDDEEGWLDALESRSLMSHAHDDSVALSIISKTREKYISIFRALERELRENWSLEE